jgi:hypothetical protein
MKAGSEKKFQDFPLPLLHQCRSLARIGFGVCALVMEAEEGM